MRYTVGYKALKPFESAEFTYPYQTLDKAIAKYSDYIPALTGKIRVTLHSGTRLLYEKYIENYRPIPPYTFSGSKETSTERIT